MARVHCSQCGADLPLEAPLRFFLGDRRMCNLKCMHAAGDRSHCGRYCGCTAYAVKRRMLREHRELMRCMETIIVENGLDEDLDELWQNTRRDPRCSRAICLNSDSELDELSDAEDPEQQLRAELTNKNAMIKAAQGELADRSAMIEAVQGALECRRKRARGNGRDHARDDHTAQKTACDNR